MKIGTAGQTRYLGAESHMREPCPNIERRPRSRRTGIAAREPVAVVTGASSGIGRALALELACRGYQVGLVARFFFFKQKTAYEIETRGGRAQVAAADVGDRQALHAAIQQIECAFGPVDVIIANAGFGAPTRLA